MTNVNNKFTNLIFEGGGAKGCAYAGCVDVLVEHGMYNSVTQIGGTSAGAITASILATGAGNAGLTESVKDTDFRNFVKDKWGIIGDAERLIEGYGLHTGTGFVSTLKQYFGEFSGNSEITFAELEKLAIAQPLKFKKLTVIASNVTKNSSQIFNAKNSPNLPIWQAVRASMSIPLVFEPAKIHDNLFVDGGLAWNYPIDLYDTGLDRSVNDGKTAIRNPATLGFYLQGKGSSDFKDQAIKIDSLEKFASGLMAFMYQSANLRYIHPQDLARTVFVDDLGVSSTDFSIPESMVDKLISSGRTATEAFIKQLDASLLRNPAA